MYLNDIELFSYNEAIVPVLPVDLSYIKNSDEMAGFAGSHANMAVRTKYS